MRTVTQARYLLTGSMQLSGGKLILDAKLIDVKLNKVVVTARADGPQDDIFAIEQTLVEKVTAGIDVKLKNEPARKRARVPSLEALIAYSKAIDLTDQGKVEEADKAFSALVSKSPTFLMARERKEAAVKAFEDYKKRQKEIVTASAIRVAKAADDVLTKENEFEGLAPSDQARLLAMRRVKGHFLARVLKQYLSSRGDSSVRVILKAKKQQALEGLRAWYANQQRYLAELEQFDRARQNRWPELTLAPELVNDLNDSGLGPWELVEAGQAFETLADFVLDGRISMGTSARRDAASFTVAPTFGDLFPDEEKKLWKAYDDRIARALQVAQAASPSDRDLTARAAINLLDEKAERLSRDFRDDDVVSTLQVVLDNFPTDPRNASREETIKRLLGGNYSSRRDDRERWLKALKGGCDDMDLRVGARFAVDDRQRHLGIDGIDVLWAELIKGCPPSAKTRHALAYVATQLAMDAARYDDCELAKKYWHLYVEHGGSVGDMLGYHKNYVPWCDYGDVTRGVQWIKFLLDGGWTPNVDQGLMSVRAHDGRQLALRGRNEQGSVELGLSLVPSGGSWKCRDATWRTPDGKMVEGECTVTLTKEANERGDYDEGTFSATFQFKQDGLNKKVELTQGQFRLRRQ